VRSRLLVDGNGRREPFDRFDVGFFDVAQKLARIARKGFDVAPLPFHVDGVERQRRLAAARKAGENDEPFFRQFEADGFQVVVARLFDDDLLLIQIKNLKLSLYDK